MRIKTHAKVSGIPNARAAVAGGEDGQARTVNVIMSALDAHDMPTVVASLRMSPPEALDLAKRIATEAEPGCYIADTTRETVVDMRPALRYMSHLPEVGGALRRAETEESALLTKLRDTLQALAALREREEHAASVLWTPEEIAEAKRAAAEADA